MRSALRSVVLVSFPRDDHDSISQFISWTLREKFVTVAYSHDRGHESVEYGFDEGCRSKIEAWLREHGLLWIP